MSVVPAFGQMAPWLSGAGDGCVPSPEDGIFCDDDPGGWGGGSGGGGGSGWNGVVTTYNISSPTSFTFDAATLANANFQFNFEAPVTLTLNGPATAGTLSAAYAGPGTLVFQSGQFIVPWDLQHTGGTIINGGLVHLTSLEYLATNLTLAGGTLRLGSQMRGVNGLQLTGNGVVELVGREVDFTGSVARHRLSNVTGDGALVISGAGIFSLHGNNTFSGGLQLTNSANLIYDNPATLGATGASISLSHEAGVAFYYALPLTMDRPLILAAGNGYLDTLAATVNWSGTISGPGALVKAGTARLTLSGQNTYSGGTTVAAGTLEVSSDANLGTASGTLTLHDQTTLSVSDGFTSSRSLELAGGVATLSADSGTFSWLGNISGSGELFKAGNSTLVLGGTTTSTGGLNVDGGTLRLASDHSLPSGHLNLNGTLDVNGHTATAGSLSGGGNIALGTNGALTVVQSVNQTYSGQISGDGTFIKDGAATLTLTGSNTQSGGTRINAGVLAITADASLGAAGAPLTLAGGGLTIRTALSLARPIHLAGDATFTLNGAATFSGVISGTGLMTKTGAATLTLANENTFTGGFLLNEGALRLTNGLALATTSLTLNASTSVSFSQVSSAVLGGLSGSGTLSLTTDVTVNESGNRTFSGTLSGSGGFAKTGVGTLTLAGNSTNTGSTVVREGILTTGAANALSAASSLFIVNHATVQLHGFNQTVGDLDSYNFVTRVNEAGTLDLGGATLTNLNRVTNNWAGSLTGTGTLVKQGTAIMNWSGANTFTGTLQIDAGTISAHAANVFSPHATLALAAGTNVLLNNYAQSISGLTGAGTLSLGSAPLTVSQSADTTFSGAITGSGSLTKSGSGTLILSGSNGFSGGVTLAAGTLQVASAQAIGSTGTLVFNGGTLQFSSANTTDYSARFSNAANQAFRIDTNGQDVAFASPLTSAGGSLTKTGAGALTLSGANTYSGDTTVATGTLRAGAAGTLSSSSAYTVAAGATLDLNGHAQTLRSLAGAGTIALGSAKLTANQADNTIFSGAISGTGALTKTGTGTLTLAGTANYTGATIVEQGILATGAANALSDASSLSIVNHATVQLHGFNQTVGDLDSYNSVTGVNESGTLDLGGATLTNLNRVTNHWAGSLTGTGSLVKKGAAIMNWSGANTFTGTLQIDTGTVRTDAADSLSPNAAVQIASGATLDLNSFNQTIAGLAGSGSVVLGSATLTSAPVTDTTFSGVISGSGALTKSGAGTLTLSGSNTFTGGTTVRQGTLAVKGGTISHPSAALVVGRQAGDNATLTITDTGSVSTSLGTIGQEAGSTGSATVTDSTWTATGGINVGLNGTGSLTVNNSTLSGASYIGRNAGSNGTVTMNSGTWTTGASYVGDAGTGALIINGGMRRGLTSYIGRFAGGNGTVTVNGGTFRNNYLIVGGNGTGTLNLTGGLVTGLYFYLGDGATGVGNATVNGGTWTASYIGVGTNGTGHLLINGGTVTDESADIGAYGLPSSATVTGGTWNHSIGFGVSAGSTLLINGGAVTSVDAYIGADSGAPSRATVSSGSLAVSGEFYLAIANGSQGILDVTNTGVVTVGSGGTGTVTLGYNAGGSSMLNIGTGGSAGTLQAASVTTGPGVGTVNFNHTGNLTFAPQLTGTLSVNKIGAGTTVLTANNTYTGATTVTAGKLVVDGSIANSAVTVKSGATLGGSGSLASLTLESGATLTPGNSPGQLTVTGNATWNGGANYIWEINNAANPTTTAGTNYDLLSISGTLTITATSENKFTLSLASLLGNNTAGDVINFNNAVNSSYTIASATGGIFGFDANAFTINASGFTNNLNGGSWNLSQVGNAINLNFAAVASAIPEPSTYAAFAGASALVLAWYRRRQRRA